MRERGREGEKGGERGREREREEQEGEKGRESKSQRVCSTLTHGWISITIKYPHNCDRLLTLMSSSSHCPLS